MDECKCVIREKKDRLKMYGLPDVEMYSGVRDVHGTPIFEGDTIRGFFYHNERIFGKCAFKNGSFGIEWKRGDIEEFTPFTSTCNVEWECFTEYVPSKEGDNE